MYFSPDRIVFKDQIIAAANTGSVIVAADRSGAASAQRIAAVLNDDGLGRSIKDVSTGNLAFRHDYGTAGNESGYSHSAIRSCGIAAQNISVPVLHGKFRIGDWLSGHRIQFFQRQTAQRLIEENEGLRILWIDRDGLGLGTLVDNIARSCLDLLCDDGTRHTGDTDFSFIVRSVEAIAAQVAVVIIYKTTIGVGELELCPGDQSTGYTVLFLDDQSTGALVPKRKLLHLAGFYENVLRGSVKNIALHGLDFSGNHGGAGFDAVQNDLAGVISIIDSVIRSDRCAAPINYFEGYTAQRFVCSPLNEFADDKGRGRFVVKGQAVGNASPDNDVFRGLVLDIARRGFAFGHYDGSVRCQPGDGHSPIGPGDISAIVGPDGPALTVPNGELRALQRLFRHSIPFEDGQGAEGIIVKAESLGITRIDHDCLRCGVCLVIVRCPDFSYDQCSRLYFGEDDLAIDIGGIETVAAGQAFVIRQQFAIGIDDFELSAGQRQLCNAVIFFYDQAALGGMAGDSGIPTVEVSPEQLAAKAAELVPQGNIGVAYTYNEPLIGYEYVQNCAALVHEQGMVNVLVTNGTVEEEPWRALLPLIDAANIDLKGFTSAWYRRLGGDLETVKRSIALAAERCHVEVTTLLIPGENDSKEEIRELARWLASISSEIPLHLSRFFPRYQMLDRPPAPVEQVSRLAETARRYLSYVYTGNC